MEKHPFENKCKGNSSSFFTSKTPANHSYETFKQTGKALLLPTTVAAPQAHAHVLKQRSATASYDFFQQTGQARLLPKMEPAHHSYAYSLVKKSAGTLAREQIEHQLQHRVPKAVGPLAAVLETAEFLESANHREKLSLDAGYSPDEAKTCANVGAFSETSTKALGLGVAGALAVKSGRMKAPNVIANTVVVHYVADQVGDVTQGLCHAMHKVARDEGQHLDDSHTEASGARPMPTMRRW